MLAQSARSRIRDRMNYSSICGKGTRNIKVSLVNVIARDAKSVARSARPNLIFNDIRMQGILQITSRIRTSTNVSVSVAMALYEIEWLLISPSTIASPSPKLSSIASQTEAMTSSATSL